MSPALDERQEQQRLQAHYAELDRLQRAATWTRTVEERQELQERWDHVQAEAAQREQEAKDRAERDQATRDEKVRRIAEAELQRQQAWARERDRLNVELEDARGILSAVSGGSAELSTLQSERLRAAIRKVAAARLVADAEAAAEAHQRANGRG